MNKACLLRLGGHSNHLQVLVAVLVVGAWQW